MKILRTWIVRLAALALAAVVPSCGGGGGGTGQVGSTSALWNSTAGVGTQPNGPPIVWHQPDGVTGAAPLPPDPQDLITYTMPIIYILGLKHPLSTVVSSKDAPNIVLSESRVRDLLTQYRHNEYVILLGNPKPLPAAADLQDMPNLTSCARAHCKHYPVWHPNTPFGLTNPEGDDLAGRLTKCQMTAAALGDNILSGTAYQSPDTVATTWITALGAVPNGTLLDPGWTHLDVGFWQLGGTVDTYYWEMILAQNPGTNIVSPTLPFPIFP